MRGDLTHTICAVMYKPLSMDLDKFLSQLEQEFLERLSDGAGKDLVLMDNFNVNVNSPKPCKYSVHQEITANNTTKWFYTSN